MARIAVSLILGVGLLGHSPAAPVPPEADRPRFYMPTQVGTKWVYQWRSAGLLQIDLTDAKMEKDGSTVITMEYDEEDGRRRIWEKVAVSADGLFMVEDKWLRRTDPPIWWIKTAAKPGKKWDFNTNYWVGDPPSQVIGTVEYIGSERIRVPAGEFTAIRVRATVVSRGWGPPSQDRWYARGVGMVQRLDKGDQKPIVLKSFTPGKD